MGVYRGIRPATVHVTPARVAAGRWLGGATGAGRLAKRPARRMPRTVESDPVLEYRRGLTPELRSTCIVSSSAPSPGGRGDRRFAPRPLAGEGPREGEEHRRFAPRPLRGRGAEVEGGHCWFAPLAGGAGGEGRTAGLRSLARLRERGRREREDLPVCSRPLAGGPGGGAARQTDGLAHRRRWSNVANHCASASACARQSSSCKRKSR